jgi:hypothetical protein
MRSTTLQCGQQLPELADDRHVFIYILVVRVEIVRDVVVRRSLQHEFCKYGRPSDVLNTRSLLYTISFINSVNPTLYPIILVLIIPKAELRDVPLLHRLHKFFDELFDIPRRDLGCWFCLY